jgi:hypothetical protein
MRHGQEGQWQHQAFPVAAGRVISGCGLPGPGAGELSVQLVYYRGLSECRSSRWISQPQHLAGLMERIECRMGHTQLGKILAHAKREIFPAVAVTVWKIAGCFKPRRIGRKTTAISTLVAYPEQV